MQNPETSPSDTLSESSSLNEQRSANRVALLIRSAKIGCAHGEFLCIVRDVSENGLKLQLFHDLPDCETFVLELANGDRFDILPVWQKDNRAGFRFDRSVELHKILAEESCFPKRPIRLHLTERAVISVAGQSCAAKVCDISREGLRIETDFPLMLAQKLRIWSDHLPALDAVVRWRNMPSYGLVLPNVLSFEELAVIAARIQKPQERAGKNRWRQAGLNFMASPFMQ